MEMKITMYDVAIKKNIKVGKTWKKKSVDITTQDSAGLEIGKIFTIQQILWEGFQEDRKCGIQGCRKRHPKMCKFWVNDEKMTLKKC